MSSGPADLFLSALYVAWVNFFQSNLHCPTSRTVLPRLPLPFGARCVGISILRKKSPAAALVPLRMTWDKWASAFKVPLCWVSTSSAGSALQVAACFLAIESVLYRWAASAKSRCRFTTIVSRSSRNLHPECKNSEHKSRDNKLNAIIRFTLRDLFLSHN
jgi:hypothetical protein